MCGFGTVPFQTPPLVEALLVVSDVPRGSSVAADSVRAGHRASGPDPAPAPHRRRLFPALRKPCSLMPWTLGIVISTSTPPGHRTSAESGSGAMDHVRQADGHPAALNDERPLGYLTRSIPDAPQTSAPRRPGTGKHVPQDFPS